MDKVIFNLKRYWQIKDETVDLYEEIKAGRKTSEWRIASKHWYSRLLIPFEKTAIRYSGDIELFADFTEYLKVHRAWFVVGYPKRSIPRLEADIIALIYWNEKYSATLDISQFEIKIANINEVLA